MTFSAYQIESLLEDFQHNNFPIEKSAGDILNISEIAKKDSHKFFRSSKNSNLGWISPESLCDLVEDKTTYDPIVNYVQQSRAGRFVEPKYIPENPAPPFSLVSNHIQDKNKTDLNKKETLQNTNSENDKLKIDEKSANFTQEDEVSVSGPNTSVELKTSIITESSYSHDQFQDDKNLDDQNGINTKEPKKTEGMEQIVDSNSDFGYIDDDDQDEDFGSNQEGLTEEINDDNDVVFGEGPIIKSSIIKFVEDFPESAIKFLLRKNLDGRPLPIEYEDIYQKWESRGLSRSRVKGYLFNLMQWNDFPEIPIIEVLGKIREHLFDQKEKKK